MLASEMPAHEHAQARAAAAAALLVDLQGHAVEADGVVARHDARLFVTQDLMEVVAADGDEGTSGIGGGVSEAGVVIGDEAVAQIAVGRGHRADVGHPELVDEAPLPGAVGPFAPAARLGREAHDVLDTELGEGAAHLGELAPIGGGARGRRVDGPPRAVGVEPPGIP